MYVCSFVVSNSGVISGAARRGTQLSSGDTRRLSFAMVNGTTGSFHLGDYVQ